MRLAELHTDLREPAVVAQARLDLRGIKPARLDGEFVQRRVGPHPSLRGVDDVLHLAEAYPRRDDGHAARPARAVDFARARRGIGVEHEAHVGDAV